MTHKEAKEILSKNIDAGKYSTYYEKKKNYILESEKGLIYKARRLAEVQAKIERVKEMTLPEAIKIAIEWKKSSVWGLNPHCTVSINYDKFIGTASGCGYNKASAAFAQAINSSDWALFFCSLGIKQYGIRDFYFEGGVGMECFERFFEKLGYSRSYMSSSTFDGWEFRWA